MTRITIVTRLRFLAAIAPAILLIAAPYLAGAFYLFGGQIAGLHDRELSAIQAARGMDVALYQMEWGRTQPDSSEILMDQQRAFRNWLDLARDRVETDQQHQILATVANNAQPVFAQIRNAAPNDEAVAHQLRDLHGQINDLIGADDAILMNMADATRHEARFLIVVTLAAALAIPWICFVFVYTASGKVRTELRNARDHLERLRDSAAAGASNSDFAAIDESLASLGFPKPNPMLAE